MPVFRLGYALMMPWVLPFFFCAELLSFKMAFAEKDTVTRLCGDSCQIARILILKISYQFCQGYGSSISFSPLCCCWTYKEFLCSASACFLKEYFLSINLFRENKYENSTYLILLHSVEGCKTHMQTLECVAVRRNVTELWDWQNCVCTDLGWECYVF